MGTFSTILVFWSSSQRVGGQSSKKISSGNKSSPTQQNLWSIKLSEMKRFHSMYHSLAITHTLQKVSPTMQTAHRYMPCLLHFPPSLSLHLHCAAQGAGERASMWVKKSNYKNCFLTALLKHLCLDFYSFCQINIKPSPLMVTKPWLVCLSIKV